MDIGTEKDKEIYITAPAEEPVTVPSPVEVPTPDVTPAPAEPVKV